MLFLSNYRLNKLLPILVFFGVLFRDSLSQALPHLFLSRSFLATEVAQLFPTALQVFGAKQDLLGIFFSLPQGKALQIYQQRRLRLGIGFLSF